MSQRPSIIVTGADLAPQALALLTDFDIVYTGKTPDEASLITLCRQRQPVALLVRYGKVTRAVIDACTNLTVISKHGVGVDTIDAAAAQERSIAVSAATGANAAAVAEHAVALILACAKSIVPLDARMRAGHWDKATHKSLELNGKTLGLVGFGAIGRRTADICRAMGMNVMIYDPFVTAAPEGVELALLETVIATADVLSLHCPLTPENRHFINAATIARMKDGAILVNTARGGLVDDEALVAALASGKLRAAGLDSFQNEPLTGGHMYRDIPNVVLSPHIGGVTADAYVAMGVGAAKNILDALSKQPRGVAAI